MVHKRKSTFAKEKYCNIANCSLFRPSLPAVRITPEPASGGHELVPLLPHGHHLSPCHSPGLLYPGVPTFDQVKFYILHLSFQRLKLSYDLKLSKLLIQQCQVSPPLHQHRPLEDKKIPPPHGGSPPTHPQVMKPRPESNLGPATLGNHHAVSGGPTQSPGGGYPTYQNSGGHQPPLQVPRSHCIV